MSDPHSQAEHHEGRLARLAHRLAEEDPRPELPRGVRLTFTIAPFVGFGLLMLAAWLVAGKRAAVFLGSMQVGSFVGLGKFVILAGLSGRAPLGVWALAGVVVYGDVGTTLVMMGNMTLLYRMPFVGSRLAAAHEAGWYVLRVHRWMRRMAWLGVVVFVAAPFQGTGAVVGTILGRLLGLSRLATLSAMACGSAVGCAALAALGSYGRDRAKQLAQHPVAAAVVGIVTVVMLIWIGRLFTGESMRRRAQDAARDGTESP